MYSKPSFYQIIQCCVFSIIFIGLVIGIPTFLCGCDNSIQSTCPNYNVVDGTLVKYRYWYGYVNKIGNMHEVDAEYHYNYNNQIHSCRICIYYSDNMHHFAHAEQKFPIGRNDTLYIAKNIQSQCNVGFDMDKKTPGYTTLGTYENTNVIILTKVGIAFLSIAAGGFLLGIIAYVYKYFSDNSYDIEQATTTTNANPNINNRINRKTFNHTNTNTPTHTNIQTESNTQIELKESMSDIISKSLVETLNTKFNTQTQTSSGLTNELEFIKIIPTEFENVNPGSNYTVYIQNKVDYQV